MFEDQTFDSILKRMLDRISADVDKREGSIAFDALAPVAAEIAQTYTVLDTILNVTFAGTSSGEFLEERTAESGVKRRPASPAIRKGIFNIDVSTGSRFRGGDMIFAITERISLGVFKLQAETAGAVGNEFTGTLLPIDHINGLTSAVLADVLIPGEDAETDADLYARYLQVINATSYGGNVGQYSEWISAIPGVGRFKIFPLWAGRGTVKASITDASNELPTVDLVNLVQETIDPDQDGEGSGLAPIGHVFTATAAVSKVVNVNLTVLFKAGFGPTDIQEDVEQLIDEYFSEINFVDTTVRLAVLSSRIIGLAQVQDLVSIQFNGASANITLSDEEIAVRGGVTIATG